MGQYLRNADVRMALDSLDRKEITYSRMVEILNEAVQKNIYIKHLYSFRFNNGYIFVIANDDLSATKIASRHLNFPLRLKLITNVFNIIDVICSDEFVYEVIYD